MEQFGFIIVLLLIGLILQKAPAPVEFAKSLNFFIIYVSLPATILMQIPKVHFDLSAFWLILIPWILLPISVVLVLWMTHNSPKEQRAAMLLVVPLGNTSFLGIPVIEALLGSDAIPYLLVYDQFGTFLILSFYATAVVATFEAGKVHKRQIFKKLLLFPPFGFLIFGLLFGEMPPTISPYIQTLSNTLIPLALISVGYSLHFGNGLEYGLLSKALVIKLFIMPLVAFGILWAFHIDTFVLKTAVLESAMPSMITAGALAIAAGFAPRLAAAMVGYGLIVSLVTLPLWLWMMEKILG